MPGLTVIIPALNAMPYLPEALASLEAQTFRDFQIILWDNGSTDGTVETARRWIPERLPGRVVSDQPLPLHLCLARMVEEAETEFIARMDADDICLPERFMIQLKALQADPSLAVVGTRIQFVDSDGNNVRGTGLPIYPSTYGQLLFSFLFTNPLAHPTVMFRRTCILQAGNYRVQRPVEDLDLWLRVAMAGKVINLKETLLLYRRHDNAVCGQHGAQNDQINALMIVTVERYCSSLYGIMPATFRALRTNTHGLALLPLSRALVSASRRSSASILSLVRSPTFCFVSRCLTSPSDFASRLLIKVLCLKSGC